MATRSTCCFRGVLSSGGEERSSAAALAPAHDRERDDGSVGVAPAGDIVAAVHRSGEVLMESHEDDGTRLRARLDAAEASRFREWAV